MTIQLGDSDDIYSMLKVGFAVYKKLRDDGTLAEIGTDLTTLRTKLGKQSIGMEISAYKAYVEAGISKETAELLLLASRLKKENLKDVFLEAFKDSMKKSEN